MRQVVRVSALYACLNWCLLSPTLVAGETGVSSPSRCASDAVDIAVACVDRFKGSVWTAPAGNMEALRSLARSGTATLQDLATLNATQLGVHAADYPCTDESVGCKDLIFALSIPGVVPSRFITTLQALVACANANKRFLTSSEWRLASAGTPRTSPPCEWEQENPGPTGNAGCASSWGVLDMGSGVHERVGGGYDEDAHYTIRDVFDIGAEGPHAVSYVGLRCARGAF